MTNIKIKKEEKYLKLRSHSKHGDKSGFVCTILNPKFRHWQRFPMQTFNHPITPKKVSDKISLVVCQSLGGTLTPGFICKLGFHKASLNIRYFSSKASTNDSDKNCITIIDSPTGSGKTYNILLAVYRSIISEDPKIHVVVLPNKMSVSTFVEELKRQFQKNEKMLDLERVYTIDRESTNRSDYFVEGGGLVSNRKLPQVIITTFGYLSKKKMGIDYNSYMLALLNLVCLYKKELIFHIDEAHIFLDNQIEAWDIAGSFVSTLGMGGKQPLKDLVRSCNINPKDDITYEHIPYFYHYDQYQNHPTLLRRDQPGADFLKTEAMPLQLVISNKGQGSQYDLFKSTGYREDDQRIKYIGNPLKENQFPISLQEKLKFAARQIGLNINLMASNKGYGLKELVNRKLACTSYVMVVKQLLWRKIGNTVTYYDERVLKSEDFKSADFKSHSDRPLQTTLSFFDIEVMTFMRKLGQVRLYSGTWNMQVLDMLKNHYTNIRDESLPVSKKSIKDQGYLFTCPLKPTAADLALLQKNIGLCIHFTQKRVESDLLTERLQNNQDTRWNYVQMVKGHQHEPLKVSSGEDPLVQSAKSIAVSHWGSVESSSMNLQHIKGASSTIRTNTPLKWIPESVLVKGNDATAKYLRDYATRSIIQQFSRVCREENLRKVLILYNYDPDLHSYIIHSEEFRAKFPLFQTIPVENTKEMVAFMIQAQNRNPAELKLIRELINMPAFVKDESSKVKLTALLKNTPASELDEIRTLWVDTVVIIFVTINTNFEHKSFSVTFGNIVDGSKEVIEVTNQNLTVVLQKLSLWDLTSTLFIHWDQNEVQNFIQTALLMSEGKLAKDFELLLKHTKSAKIISTVYTQNFVNLKSKYPDVELSTFRFRFNISEDTSTDNTVQYIILSLIQNPLYKSYLNFIQELSLFFNNRINKLLVHRWYFIPTATGVNQIINWICPKKASTDTIDTSWIKPQVDVMKFYDNELKEKVLDIVRQTESHPLMFTASNNKKKAFTFHKNNGTDKPKNEAFGFTLNVTGLNLSIGQAGLNMRNKTEQVMSKADLERNRVELLDTDVKSFYGDVVSQYPFILERDDLQKLMTVCLEKRRSNCDANTLHWFKLIQNSCFGNLINVYSNIYNPNSRFKLILMTQLKVLEWVGYVLSNKGKILWLHTDGMITQSLTEDKIASWFKTQNLSNKTQNITYFRLKAGNYSCTYGTGGSRIVGIKELNESQLTNDSINWNQTYPPIFLQLVRGLTKTPDQFLVSDWIFHFQEEAQLVDKNNNFVNVTNKPLILVKEGLGYNLLLQGKVQSWGFILSYELKSVEDIWVEGYEFWLERCLGVHVPDAEPHWHIKKEYTHTNLESETMTFISTYYQVLDLLPAKDTRLFKGSPKSVNLIKDLSRLPQTVNGVCLYLEKFICLDIDAPLPNNIIKLLETMYLKRKLIIVFGNEIAPNWVNILNESRFKIIWKNNPVIQKLLPWLEQILITYGIEVKYGPTQHVQIVGYHRNKENSKYWITGDLNDILEFPAVLAKQLIGLGKKPGSSFKESSSTNYHYAKVKDQKRVFKELVAAHQLTIVQYKDPVNKHVSLTKAVGVCPWSEKHTGLNKRKQGDFSLSLRHDNGIVIHCWHKHCKPDLFKLKTTLELRNKLNIEYGVNANNLNTDIPILDLRPETEKESEEETKEEGSDDDDNDDDDDDGRSDEEEGSEEESSDEEEESDEESSDEEEESEEESSDEEEESEEESSDEEEESEEESSDEEEESEEESSDEEEESEEESSDEEEESEEESSDEEEESKEESKKEIILSQDYFLNEKDMAPPAYFPDDYYLDEKDMAPPYYFSDMIDIDPQEEEK